jgi:segregation and condensation protein B
MEEQKQVNEKNLEPLKVLEAMLFASSEPLATSAIRERLPEGVDVGGLLLELKEDYSKRGVTLTEFDGCWAFRTADGLGDFLQVEKNIQRKLSRAAMETLAIIAYHQPVTRAEIENIRGVATHRGTLDVLMEAGWIKPGRRRESPGRPLTWVSTTEFLDYFGIEALTDLPGLDELKASGLLDRRPAIDTVRMTQELFEDEELDAIEEEMHKETE